MYDIYTVKEKETLKSIADNNNITVDELSKLNNNITFVEIGNTLLIPKNTNKYFEFYKINKEDTLYNIATRFNTNVNIVALLNGLDNDDYIYPNQTIMIPKKGTRIYITGEGDTLQGLVNGMGVNFNEFLKQNNKLYLMPEQLIVYRQEN